MCVCACFSFGFVGGMWDLIALVPDHCLSFYFDCTCLIILLVFQGKIKPLQKFVVSR